MGRWPAKTGGAGQPWWDLFASPKRMIHQPHSAGNQNSLSLSTGGGPRMSEAEGDGVYADKVMILAPLVGPFPRQNCMFTPVLTVREDGNGSMIFAVLQ